MNESEQPFSHSVGEIISSLNNQFPSLVADSFVLKMEMTGLRLFAQEVIEASEGIENVDERREFSGEAQFPTGDKPHMIHMEVGLQKFVVGGSEADNQEEQVGDQHIPVATALAYIAYQSAQKDFPERIFNLPRPDVGHEGLHAFLIAQLCMSHEKVMDWIKTTRAEEELRVILLEAVLSDKNEIERYMLRKSIGMHDDTALTHLMGEDNGERMLVYTNDMIDQLTQRASPPAEDISVGNR